MPGLEPTGPPLEDSEDVYRAILYPLQWAEGQNRPSLAAFDEAVFSVEVKSRTTPEATASRKRLVLNIVEFNCGSARRLGFDARDERDDVAPLNLAHAHVYSQADPGQRKGKARQLAKLCVSISYDLEEAERLRRLTS